jgi:hypothetical protein
VTADIHVLPSVPMPTDPEELKRCLADSFWRITSGALYWIMVKGDDDEDGEPTEVTAMPFKPNRAQRRFIARMWHRNLILKARQLGFTTLIALLWLDHALFNKNQRCGIIAQDRDTAKAIFRDKVKFAYERLPPTLLANMPVETMTAEEILFAHNNSSIRVATSVRGGTIHRLLVSEFGKICAKFPEKAEEVITGSIPAVPLSQVLVIESTAEGQDGEFFKIATRSERKHESKKKLTARDYRFHFYAWWQDPRYRMPPDDVIVTKADNEYFDRVEAVMSTQLDIEQRAWYVATREADFSGNIEKMWQEYPSTPKEAFQVSTEGTYFSDQLTRARKEGRIGFVPHDPSKVVHTFWDIGTSDQTAIWLYQRVGLADRFIGYIEGEGEPPSYYVRELNELSYIWGKDFLPHDGAHRRIQGATLKTYAEMLEELGRTDIEVVERIDDITRGINMVRDKFASVWIDETACAKGLAHLQNYKKDWNKRLGIWSDRPRHDKASNGADAFRQWAQGFEDEGGYQKIDRRGESHRTA